MPRNSFSVICASVMSLLVWARLAPAQAASPAMSSKPAQTRCEGTEAPDADAPTLADPYPLIAAGWGAVIRNGQMFSRWAEDWPGMRAAGKALPFKAMPLGGDASLTMSSEIRLRYNTFDNGQFVNHEMKWLPERKNDFLLALTHTAM